MPRFAITRKGERVDGPIDAPGPRSALQHFRVKRGYDGDVRSGPSFATLAVVGVGLFKAERLPKEEQ